MNLHIDLDSTHPAYEWLEKQADKIGAAGHFGTHIDCYTSTPDWNESCLSVYVLDCRKGMPEADVIASLPSLDKQALVLYTNNMYQNDYGTKAYFDDTDTSIHEDELRLILEKNPQLILIDSYGIGKHGKNHIYLDQICEQAGCYVIENIRIAPEDVNQIHTILLSFDLNYPSTGKPCRVVCD